MTLRLSKDFSTPGSRQTWCVRLTNGDVLRTSSREAAEQLLDTEPLAQQIEDSAGKVLVTLSAQGEHLWHHVTDDERLVLKPKAINDAG